MIVVTFDTTHDAFAFEDAARAAGVPGRLIPLPTGIRAGCGLAWLVPDADGVRAVATVEATPGVLYRRDGGVFTRLSHPAS